LGFVLPKISTTFEDMVSSKENGVENCIWAYAQILYMVSTAARGCPQGKLATLLTDTDETMIQGKKRNPS
jgi:hypothetical protein